jgi:hypothetical protein
MILTVATTLDQDFTIPKPNNHEETKQHDNNTKT